MELEEKEEAAARALEQEANSPLEAVAGGRDQHEEEEEPTEEAGGGGHPPAPAQHEEEGTGKPILPYSSMFFLSSDNMQVFLPHTLLDKFWRISLYFTDDSTYIAKLSVT